MVPIANATAAANAVISSVSLRRGDLLMMTSITYPAVRPCLLPLCHACRQKYVVCPCLSLKCSRQPQVVAP